jgi:hypothetical protein
MTTEIVPAGWKSRSEWANIINASIANVADSIIRAGQYMIDAKEQILHGEWKEFCQLDLHISTDYAAKYISIANQFGNTDDRRYLPPAVTTLYALARMEPAQLERAQDEHLITPELTEGEVKKIVQKYSESEATTFKKKKEKKEESPPQGIDQPTQEQIDHLVELVKEVKTFRWAMPWQKAFYFIQELEKWTDFTEKTVEQVEEIQTQIKESIVILKTLQGRIK